VTLPTITESCGASGELVLSSHPFAEAGRWFLASAKGWIQHIIPLPFQTLLSVLFPLLQKIFPPRTRNKSRSYLVLHGVRTLRLIEAFQAGQSQDAFIHCKSN
jgi:hypothetical protein